MLTELMIQGLAIIESLNLQLSSGFNVITGETGAGKSILIKALGLLQGMKASPDTVRNGFASATICGRFRVPSSDALLELLEGLGLAQEDESAPTVELIVRRVVHASGKSNAWLNDVPVAASTLKALSPYLIDIYAQHETGKLLDPVNHINYLDQFLPEPKRKEAYQQHYQTCIELLHAMRDLIAEFQKVDRDHDYLTFRLNEAEEFAPSLEDFEEISETLRQCEGFAEEQETLGRMKAVLAPGDEQGAEDALRALLKLSSKLPDGLSDLRSCVEQAAAMVDDVSFRVDSRLSEINLDDAELSRLNERLGAYQGFFRKFNVATVEALGAEVARLRSLLDSIEQAEGKVADLSAAFRKAIVKLKSAADALSVSRQAASKALGKALEAELVDLAMPGARFGVQFDPLSHSLAAVDLALFPNLADEAWGQALETFSALGPLGQERVRFFLSANSGEELKPLDRVASGGELSRIMLAVKQALSAGADSCVLVFDEIDTGISGRVADVVGKKIKRLAKHFQIVCISHLPQVASYGDAHFRVAKQVKDKRTESSIVRLSQKESELEIARLLSGDQVSQASLANAKALVRKAKEGAI